MSLTFLSLGSNLGDRLRYLQRGLDGLAALPDSRVFAVSSVYETAPQGYTDQGAFLNIAAAFETQLSPLALLNSIHGIEASAGRERNLRYGPRTLDIDILLYEGAVCDTPSLTLPHPRMTERAFVLVPLLEILADHPDLPTFRDALWKLPPQGVEKIPLSVRIP